MASISLRLSPEKLLQNNFQILCESIESPNPLSSHLYAAGLIGNDLRDKICTTMSLSRNDKSTELMSTLLKSLQASRDKIAFVNEIFDVLEDAGQPTLRKIVSDMRKQAGVALNVEVQKDRARKGNAIADLSAHHGITNIDSHSTTAQEVLTSTSNDTTTSTTTVSKVADGKNPEPDLCTISKLAITDDAPAEESISLPTLNSSEVTEFLSNSESCNEGSAISAPKSSMVNVDEKIACSLCDLRMKFTRVHLDVRQLMETSNIPLDDLKELLTSITEDDSFEECENYRTLFQKLRSHGNIFNPYVLCSLANEYTDLPIKNLTDGYEVYLDKFRKSTKIKELEDMLKHASSECFAGVHEQPVIMKLPKKWLDRTLKDLHDLGNYIFGVKSKVLQGPTEIWRGCVHIKWYIQQRFVELLIEVAIKRVDLLKQEELQLLQIGGVTVFHNGNLVKYKCEMAVTSTGAEITVPVIAEVQEERVKEECAITKSSVHRAVTKVDSHSITGPEVLTSTNTTTKTSTTTVSKELRLLEEKQKLNKVECELEEDDEQLVMEVPKDSLEGGIKKLVLVIPRDGLEGEECHDSHDELQRVTTSTSTLPLKDDLMEKLVLMTKMKSHMLHELNDTIASLRSEREMRKALEAKLAEAEQRLKLLEEKQKLNEVECEMEEDLDQLKLKALEAYEIPIKEEAVKCESSVQYTCTISGKIGDSLDGDCVQYKEGIQESDTAKGIFITDDISCLLDMIDQKSAVCVLHCVYRGRSQHEEQCNISV